MANQVRQVGALPWRIRGGRVEIMLITSRETRRWVIPKGWPEDHLQDYNAARKEALEEAGIAGRMPRTPIGRYSYDKRMADGSVLTAKVQVYALEVTEKFKSWPEKKERKRVWFPADEAVWEVDEEGLKQIIRDWAAKRGGST